MGPLELAKKPKETPAPFPAWPWALPSVAALPWLCPAMAKGSSLAATTLSPGRLWLTHCSAPNTFHLQVHKALISHD